MRVLVACESSGTVRRAFRERGHDAWSCDLLPADDGSPHHYQQDVIALLEPGRWDLMIAHPPCTHLAASGARWFKDKRHEQADALSFVRLLLEAPVPRIALENPVGIISSHIRPADQYIQPWWFGHPESKTTGFWLKNLPRLCPTDVLSVPESGRWENQTPSGQNNLPPSEDRWKIRSKTYAGVAEAMAEQWGEEHFTLTPYWDPVN